MSESRNSPPLLCCCGSWAGVCTRRLCPMIQPLRGLYLSCTQKRAHHTGQLHLPPSFNKVSSTSGLFFSSVFSLLPVLFAFHSSPSPVPPSHNLLKTFPPSRSWTPSLPPSRSLTLPPWLVAQVSIHWKMPTIPGRKTSYVFNLMRALRYVVQCVHPIMHVRCNVCYVVQRLSGERVLLTDPEREKLDFKNLRPQCEPWKQSSASHTGVSIFLPSSRWDDKRNRRQRYIVSV